MLKKLIKQYNKYNYYIVCLFNAFAGNRTLISSLEVTYSTTKLRMLTYHLPNAFAGNRTLISPLAMVYSTTKLRMLKYAEWDSNPRCKKHQVAQNHSDIYATMSGLLDSNQ
jgi:hypothetical protein